MTGLREVCQAFQGVRPVVSYLNCQTLQFSASFPDRESFGGIWQRLQQLGLEPTSRSINELTLIIGISPLEIREAANEFPWLATAN